MNTGISPENETKIAEELNKVLASLMVYHMKLLHFHWNISGVSFFDLHEKFEDLYKKAVESADTIAERIVGLGYTPHGTFTDLAAASKVPEFRDVPNALNMALQIVGDIEIIVVQLRGVLEVVNNTNDHGTIDILIETMRQFEKELWMMRKFCG